MAARVRSKAEGKLQKGRRPNGWETVGKTLAVFGKCAQEMNANIGIRPQCRRRHPC